MSTEVDLTLNEKKELFKTIYELTLGSKLIWVLEDQVYRSRLDCFTLEIHGCKLRMYLRDVQVLVIHLSDSSLDQLLLAINTRLTDNLRTIILQFLNIALQTSCEPPVVVDEENCDHDGGNGDGDGDEDHHDDDHDDDNSGGNDGGSNDNLSSCLTFLEERLAELNALAATQNGQPRKETLIRAEEVQYLIDKLLT